jgi:hypothetical protein
MVSYGQTISWRERGGVHRNISYADFDTPEEAYQEVMAAAKAYGWTPPRWWQWWRWGDLDYEKLHRITRR